MYGVLIAIHVIASIFLIAVILLQAGRGGGLADSFGGSQIQSLFGTKTTNVLTKLTTVCASMFIITCIALAIISSHRSRSVIEKINIPDVAAKVDVSIPGDVAEGTADLAGPAAVPGTAEGPVEE